MALPQFEHNRGYYNEILRSIYDDSIKSVLRSWVKEIMNSPEMSEAERRGKISAYQEIYKGFLTMYENSKLNIPEWLTEEFE